MRCISPCFAAVIVVFPLAWLAAPDPHAAPSPYSPSHTGQLSPRIDSVSPQPIIGSNTRQWLTINGGGFARGFTVELRTDSIEAHITDQARLYYLSPNHVQVRATLGNEAATWHVRVVNPEGSASSWHEFTTEAPEPRIEGLNPLWVMAGAQGLALNVMGSTFTSYSVIYWNDTPLPTTPVFSSTSANAITAGLRAFLPDSALRKVGRASVSVFTPGPGGGQAPAFVFTIEPKPFYASLWFVLLAGVFVAGLGFLLLKLYRYRLDRLRRQVREEKLLALVAERTRNLEAENEKTEHQAQQLQHQAERLEELSRMKNRFIANLSHEFRTPLTLILAPIQDLLAQEEDALDPAHRRQLEVAFRNARRMEELIDQLLDLARLEAGQLYVRPTRGDVASAVQEMVQRFAPLAERERVRLTFRAGALPLLCAFDATQLDKVVSNLLSNALKFTPEGGRVLVTVAAAGAEVEIKVRDSGIGIPAEALPHVFERFYQVDASPARAHEGAGIGLSLVKELVELHGGRVEVQSDCAFGSEFTVRLPREAAQDEDARVLQDVEIVVTDWSAAEEDQAGAALPPAPACLPAATEQEAAPTVLVVEDNADVRAYLRTHLSPSYRVLEAADGAEALEHARAHPPDLIVSDVMMPGMDGLALCRALKADAHLSDIPVLLLTARAEEADAVEGLEAGAADYLRKPFHMAELCARIDGLIRSRQTLRARFSREVVVQPYGTVVTPAGEAFLERVHAVAEANLRRSDFTVEQFAEEIRLSKSQLNRKLRSATGLSTAAFVRQLRLERAARMLAGGAGPVSQVAYAVGFTDLDHFARLFKKKFGVPPSQYRADAAK